MAYIVYAGVVLVTSVLIGMHLGRFREAYTEMTGMMAGMTMGMLNGFVLGYAAAAFTSSMFWGNLVGIVLGVGLGAYYGRAGSLMGIMDGGMGGVMGGSMGAMLAVMVAFPREAQFWTAILLGVLYVLGMGGLVALIEQSTPQHAAFHRVLPMFARAMAVEAVEAAEEAEQSQRTASPEKARKLVDYYALLGVPNNASHDDISNAYADEMDGAGSGQSERLERAYTVLTDPSRRALYDRRLAELLGSVATQATAAASTAATSTTVRIPPNGQNLSAQGVAPGSFSNNSSNDEAGPGSYNGAGASSATTSRPYAPATNSGKGKSMQHGKGSKGNVQRQGNTQPTQKQTARYQQQQPQQQLPSQPVPQKQGQRPKQQASGLGSGTKAGIGFAGLLAITLLAFWLFTSGAQGGATSVPGPNGQSSVPPDAAQAQAEQIAQIVPVGADGKQSVDIVLDSATFQYKPKSVKVKANILVHFNLSVINGDPG